MRRFSDIVVLFLAAIVLTLPLLTRWTSGGHDFLYYLMYAQQFAANLRDGVLLPAWAADLNYGFGSPALMLYPPLVNFIHALALVAGIPLTTATGLLACLALFLSGLSARMWLRQTLDGPRALSGALAYMIAPYRMIDLYERTALAEHWAFLYPPIILWAIRSPRPALQRIVIIALASAAMVMTNLPLAVLFGMVIAAYLILSARRSLLPALAGATLGFAIAAISLVPQAASSKYVRTELWFGSASRYRPSLHTIFNRAGENPYFNSRVSLVVVATFLLIAIAAFFLRRELDREARFWIFTGVIAFLFTTSLTAPVWDHVPVLSRLQFPWRAAAVLTLAAAALIAHVPSKTIRNALVVVAVFSAAPFIGKSTLRRELFAHPVPAAVAARLFPDPRAIAEIGAVHSNTTHEHMIDIWFVPRTANLRFIDELPAPNPRIGRIIQRPAIFNEDPNAPLRITKWRRLERAITIDVARSGTLIWHALAFPTMEFRVDGRPATLLVHEGSGLASVALSPGKHEVLWRWRPFPELMLGRWISLAGLVVSGLLCLLSFALTVRDERINVDPDRSS